MFTSPVKSEEPEFLLQGRPAAPWPGRSAIAARRAAFAPAGLINDIQIISDVVKHTWAAVHTCSM